MQTQPELPRTSHATSKFSIPTLVSMALLCALSLVVTFVCNFIPPVAGILSFDLKGVVLAIGGFLFGPVPAFFTALAAALIEMVSFSGTGPIGI